MRTEKGDDLNPRYMDRFIDSIEWIAAIFVGVVAADVFISIMLRYFFSYQIPDSYSIGQQLLGCPKDDTPRRRVHQASRSIVAAVERRKRLGGSRPAPLPPGPSRCGVLTRNGTHPPRTRRWSAAPGPAPASTLTQERVVSVR